MRILALDTSSAACSAALWVNDEIIERYELAPRQHGELLLPMVEAVLAEAQCSIYQLDALAFGAGPGSFTSLRIGISVAQGIALAADLPGVPVSSLLAIARDAVQQTNLSWIAVAMDARQQQVYACNYHADGPDRIKPLYDEKVCDPSQLTLGDYAAPNHWCGAGNGWETYAEALQPLAVKTVESRLYPRAGDIAELSYQAWQQGAIVTAENILPRYIRQRVTS